jgi:hypothetical protein
MLCSFPDYWQALGERALVSVAAYPGSQAWMVWMPIAHQLAQQALSFVLVVLCRRVVRQGREALLWYAEATASIELDMESQTPSCVEAGRIIAYVVR